MHPGEVVLRAKRIDKTDNNSPWHLVDTVLYSRVFTYRYNFDWWSWKISACISACHRAFDREIISSDLLPILLLPVILPRWCLLLELFCSRQIVFFSLLRTVLSAKPYCNPSRHLCQRHPLSAVIACGPIFLPWPQFALYDTPRFWGSISCFFDLKTMPPLANLNFFHLFLSHWLAQRFRGWTQPVIGSCCWNIKQLG